MESGVAGKGVRAEWKGGAVREAARMERSPLVSSADAGRGMRRGQHRKGERPKAKKEHRLSKERGGSNTLAMPFVAPPSTRSNGNACPFIPGRAARSVHKSSSDWPLKKGHLK